VIGETLSSAEQRSIMQKKIYDQYEIYAEFGEEFQEFVYEDGTFVPMGTPIGIETEYQDGSVELKLHPGIFYSDTSRQHDTEHLSGN